MNDVDYASASSRSTELHELSGYVRLIMKIAFNRDVRREIGRNAVSLRDQFDCWRDRPRSLGCGKDVPGSIFLKSFRETFSRKIFLCGSVICIGVRLRIRQFTSYL